MVWGITGGAAGFWLAFWIMDELIGFMGVSWYGRYGLRELDYEYTLGSDYHFRCSSFLLSI